MLSKVKVKSIIKLPILVFSIEIYAGDITCSPKHGGQYVCNSTEYLKPLSDSMFPCSKEQIILRGST